MDYQVIIGQGKSLDLAIDSLTDQIKKLLSKGYTLAGGVSVVTGQLGTWALQAVSKQGKVTK